MDEAARVYEDCLVVDPDQAGIFIILAEIHLALNRPAKAAEGYKKALAVEPRQADAQNNLGVILKSLDKPDEAEDCFNRALEINPDLAEARANLGEILRNRGELEKAGECLVRALEIKPDLAPARALLGLVRLDLGRVGEAVDCLRLSLSLDNTAPEVHYHLGSALMTLERYSEAVTAFQTVLELAPDFPRPADLAKKLGLALLRTGYFQAAASALAYSWKIAPGDLEIKEGFQEAVSRQKEIEQAVRVFQQRLRLESKPGISESGSCPAPPADSDPDEGISLEEASKNVVPEVMLRHGRPRTGPAADRDFLHGLITSDFPQFDQALADEWETVKILRQFTYQRINEAYDESVCLDQDPAFGLPHRTATEIFQAFMQDKGGVWCGGAAKTYYKLCREYGFKCHMINLGYLSGGLSHVTTVVEINRKGAGMLVIQDPYLNTCYMDLSGEPMDYFEFLTKLKNRGHESIAAEVNEQQTRYYLVPSAHEDEVACTWHFRRNDQTPTPVARLANGNLKYVVRPSGGLLLDTNQGLQRFLADRGHPADILYFFLYPSAVYSDHGIRYPAGKSLKPWTEAPGKSKKRSSPTRGRSIFTAGRFEEAGGQGNKPGTVNVNLYYHFQKF